MVTRVPRLGQACLSESCNVPIHTHQSSGKKECETRKETPNFQADFIPVPWPCPRFSFSQMLLRADYGPSNTDVWGQRSLCRGGRGPLCSVGYLLASLASIH